uniref:Uncharacterized protein n=1 Tax=viral metagenome TaxID=1070528 RepID=A0A6C0BT82_9ZZZZ
MDLVILIGAILVYFAYFVKSCPNIIKKYRQLLLGIIIGLLIYKYVNIEGNIEGFTMSDGLVKLLAILFVIAVFILIIGRNRRGRSLGRTESSRWEDDGDD